jgi:hypothetical protein
MMERRNFLQKAFAVPAATLVSLGVLKARDGASKGLKTDGSSNGFNWPEEFNYQGNCFELDQMSKNKMFPK